MTRKLTWKPGSWNFSITMESNTEVFEAPENSDTRVTAEKSADAGSTRSSSTYCSVTSEVDKQAPEASNVTGVRGEMQAFTNGQMAIDTTALGETSDSRSECLVKYCLRDIGRASVKSLLNDEHLNPPPMKKSKPSEDPVRLEAFDYVGYVPNLDDDFPYVIHNEFNPLSCLCGYCRFSLTDEEEDKENVV